MEVNALEMGLLPTATNANALRASQEPIAKTKKTHVRIAASLRKMRPLERMCASVPLALPAAFARKSVRK